MELTKQNYFSVEANMEYMGATQFKDFMKCENEGLSSRQYRCGKKRCKVKPKDRCNHYREK